MKKVIIAVGWKDGECKVLAEGSDAEVLAAYKEAAADPSYDDVGMLRKPRWYKYNSPARNKIREDAKALHNARRVEAELAQQVADAERIEAVRTRLKEQREIAEAKAEIVREDLIAANDAKQTVLDGMSEKEKQGKLAERMINEDALTRDKGLSPSVEDLRASDASKEAEKTQDKTDKPAAKTKKAKK